jgi:hypothetical protein
LEKRLASLGNLGYFLNPLNGYQGNEARKRYMFFLQDSGQLIVLLSTEFGTWSSKVYKLRSIGNNCENLCPPLVNYLLSNRLVTVIIVGCSCNCSLLLHLCHNCSSCLRCLLGGHMVDLVSYFFQKLRNHHIVKQSQCFIDLPPR